MEDTNRTKVVKTKRQKVQLFEKNEFEWGVVYTCRGSPRRHRKGLLPTLNLEKA
jgi:hypothetical protein